MTTKKRKYIRNIFGLLAVSLVLLFGVTFIVKNKNLTTSQLSLPAGIPTRSIQALQATLEVKYGNAVVERAGTKQTIVENGEHVLADGDIITTADKTLAIIQYQEGTVVRIDKNTSLTFTKDTLTSTSVTQLSGSIFVRFNKLLGKREAISVETPTAIATVRGTSFASFVKNPNETKIVVTENMVDVFKRDEKSGTFDESSKKSVGVNQQARIQKEIIVEVVTLDPDEMKWIEFNKIADLALGEANAIPKLIAILTAPTSTPTPKPVTPTPSRPPAPTRPPLLSIEKMPSEGFSRSQVSTDVGTFTLSCMGANKNTTRVITDSGNDSDCKDNCTVLPLREFATRNNGFAAMNGIYYCPADYSWCAGKVNSFDTLFFNSRTKTYLNSDNNVYSVIPFLAVEANGNPLFKRHSHEWGRDTGIMAGTAGNPLMIAGGSTVVGDYTLDTKMQTVKSARTAFVSEGDSIYLCVVAGATVPDATKVYAKLGADNAINFDSGGTTAFWVNGSYIYGPGRNLATAIIFARK